ncbi:unnamed protein product, partial [Ectocarpus sp. 13 AM-2016]
CRSLHLPRGDHTDSLSSAPPSRTVAVERAWGSAKGSPPALVDLTSRCSGFTVKNWLPDRGLLPVNSTFPTLLYALNNFEVRNVSNQHVPHPTSFAKFLLWRLTNPSLFSK